MKQITLSESLWDYVSQHQSPIHPCLTELAILTQKRIDGRMQINPVQGVFMNQLAKLLQAKKILEIGCFTGYSTIALGMALPHHGTLISCDVNEETSAIARRFLELCGLKDKVEIKIQPAKMTLDHLIAQGHEATFDLCFIDADKTGYLSYYERCLTLLRPGGVILVDNALWGGSVVDHQVQDSDTKAIRELNRIISRDPRVEHTLLPIADGLYMVRKKDL